MCQEEQDDPAKTDKGSTVMWTASQANSVIEAGERGNCKKGIVSVDK